MRRRDERQWRPGDGTLPSRLPRCPRLAEAVAAAAPSPPPDPGRGGPTASAEGQPSGGGREGGCGGALPP
uniref:Uncharacterized protein n=1 Tax=Oryza glaberrima TaxID=4538 RepID=I1P016_ORYGL